MFQTLRDVEENFPDKDIVVVACEVRYGGSVGDREINLRCLIVPKGPCHQADPSQRPLATDDGA